MLPCTWPHQKLAMRLEANRNYGDVPRRNRWGRQRGAHLAITQPPLHRQILRRVPERRRLPQHRNELRRRRWPEPKDQRSQVKTISFCLIANSSLVFTGLLSDSACPREEDNPSRYKIAEYFFNKVGQRKIRRFWNSSSFAANFAENQECCWYALLHVTWNLWKQGIFLQNWYLVTWSHLARNVPFKTTFWCQLPASTCTQNLKGRVLPCPQTLLQRIETVSGWNDAGWSC